MFDLHNDEDLDTATTDFNSEPHVLISDLAQRQQIHWLKVTLTGTSSNRNGLGATVRVHAAGQTYTKYNDGKSGYLAQSALPLYFGLGEATKVDPSKSTGLPEKKQVVSTGLSENQTVQITEPK
jgi:enediyne biosynthesis protein E4